MLRDSKVVVKKAPCCLLNDYSVLVLVLLGFMENSLLSRLKCLF